jgi:Tol biopolymer transport system component
MTRDGKRKRRVSRAGESVVASAWSPKGDTLAFVAGTPNPYGGSPGNLRLETARANGTRLRVLKRSSDSSRISFSAGPIWTPNAKRILVTVESH